MKRPSEVAFQRVLDQVRYDCERVYAGGHFHELPLAVQLSLTEKALASASAFAHCEHPKKARDALIAAASMAVVVAAAISRRSA